jgi:hypothetical protein
LAIYGRSAGGLLIGAVMNMRPDLFKAVLTEVPFVDVINTMFDSTIPWTAFEYEVTKKLISTCTCLTIIYMTLLHFLNKKYVFRSIFQMQFIKKEWGNPVDNEIYEIMKSYCPYSNVIRNGLYPHTLIVGGMNDPRVAYFEPAKWTAKLRAMAQWQGSTMTSKTNSGEKLETTADTENSSAAPTEASDRLLMLKIQEAGHMGSSGQYSKFEDLAFEYAFLISTLGAQFRPVSSGGKGLSLSGVDYDMYWDELEEGNEELVDEDEEEIVGEETPAPSTPLQRFSEFWRRRSTKKATKPAISTVNSKVALAKKNSRRGTFSSQTIPENNARRSGHNRSSSLVKGLNIIRNLSRGNTPATSDVNDDGEGKQKGSPTEEQSKESITVTASEAEEHEENVHALPSNMIRLPRRQSPSTTPNSSKASLRHQYYPQDDDSGRVQSSSRLYTFISKFF